MHTQFNIYRKVSRLSLERFAAQGARSQGIRRFAGGKNRYGFETRFISFGVGLDFVREAVLRVLG
jgi:hypothetical protein